MSMLKQGAPLYGGVLSGLGGLVWHGLSNLFQDTFYFAATDKALEKFSFYGASFCYVPEIDEKNFLLPCPYNKKILIPTPERSLVLYQKYEALVPYDDEHLMIGLQRYRRMHQGDNCSLLKVADFYGRREDIIKSWNSSESWDSES